MYLPDLSDQLLEEFVNLMIEENGDFDEESNESTKLAIENTIQFIVAEYLQQRREKRLATLTAQIFYDNKGVV